jgi:ADP-heptose:LPS heptosyltransferase
VVLLGGPAERALEAEAAAALARLPAPSAGANAILSIGKLDFAAAARLAAEAAAIVSSDTGIGHLAIMLRRPVVIVAGGGHFGSFVPYPPELTPSATRFVYHAMPCYHCDWDCTMKAPQDPTFPCVAGVSADRVWQAVVELDCLPRGGPARAPALDKAPTRP